MSDPVEQGRRIHALFREGLDLPAAERRAWLDRLRQEDPYVVRRVEAMLAVSEDGARPGFLEPAVLRGGPLWNELSRAMRDGEPPHEGCPEHIGRYRILRELGRGGMAFVYLAERDDGAYDQQVALKIMRVGLTGDDAVRRFRQERQILASLEHPNIARLLDGGVAEDGRPYLVMEYVDGLPIDAYAQAQDLSVAQRIELVATISDALGHAHRRLIVHRDLKPSNIVVGHDARVRLLDFGIAKLLQPEALPGAATETRTHLRLLTPSYASPEQVLGQPVGTASDIYQLGLLLFELLTGSRPYEVDGLSAGQLERAICETEPARPSAVATAATRRRALRGDLDAVVLKALAKQPDQRYESGSALAEDLRRYLTGLPVRAQSPTWRYLAANLARRHRVAFAAGGLVLASLLVGLAGTIWQARRAAAERDRAQLETQRANQIKEYVLDLFRKADPRPRGGQPMTVADLLKQGLDRVPEGLDGQPAVQADVLDMIGKMMGDMSQDAGGVPALERALELRQQAGGGSPEDLARTQNLLAEGYVRAGRLDEALQLARAAHDSFERDPPDDPVKFGTIKESLGKILVELGRYDEASRYLEESVAWLRGRAGEDNGYTLRAIGRLADLRRRQGRAEESLELMEEAVGIARQVADREQLASLLHTLGTAYHSLERLEPAERCYREAIDIRSEILGPDAVILAWTLNNLGSLLSDRGDLEAAEPVLRKTLELKKKGFGEKHPALISSLNNLALVLVRRGQLAEAESLIVESSSLARGQFKPGHPAIADCSQALAELRLAQGRPRDAEGLLQEALSIYRDSFPEDHPKIRESLDLLAKVRGLRDSPAQGAVKAP